jgi:hypothetical protein
MASPISHDPEFWAAAETLKKTREQKLCLAASHFDPCQGNIISAHTIPRSQLQNIAENGHVDCFAGDLPTFNETGGEVKIVQKGIKKFSVLNCFCAHHDVDLFSPVENYPLTFTAEQIAILHYRAIASEVYRKMTALNGFGQAIAQASKGKKFKNTTYRRELSESYIHGTKLGIVDIGKTFKSCENIVYNKNYSDMSALIVKFDRPPSIMSVGAFSPEFDYGGNRLQSLHDESIICDEVSLSILVAGGRAAVIFAWLKDANVGRRFAESFIRQKPELYTALAIQTAFEHLENTCMRSSWWGGLKAVERQALHQRMNVAISFSRRDSSALRFGGITFDDWGYSDSQFANV